MRPTPAGEELAARGRRVVSGVADLESQMAGRARGLRGSIALAANSSAVDALTEFLAATLNRLPSLAVTLAELGSDEAVDAVREGRADLAVVSVVAQDRAPIAPCAARPLWDDPLVAVGAASSGTPAPLRLDDVLREPVVGLLPGVPLQERIEQRARDRGLVPAYRVRLPSLAAVCAVAGTGVGRAVVPLGAARRHGVPASGIHPLDEAWAWRRALLVARDFAAFDAGTAAFTALLEAYAPAVDAGE
ncbi:LysR family transcriptional regulator [Nocardiopsis coralliicola]